MVRWPSTSDEGDHVHLKRGRVIEVMTETLLVKAGTKVRFETPLIETTGQIHAEDDIRSDAQVVDQVRSMQKIATSITAINTAIVPHQASNSNPPGRNSTPRRNSTPHARGALCIHGRRHKPNYRRFDRPADFNAGKRRVPAANDSAGQLLGRPGAGLATS